MAGFQYVIIAVNPNNDNIKTVVKDLKFLYHKQLYYIGSDSDYTLFCKKFGHIDRIIDGDFYEVIQKSSETYLDEESVEVFGDLKMTKKIKII
jgi:hypothetical protein